MATNEELEKQRQELNRARFSGARQVQHGDKSVTNRSVAELRMADADLKKEMHRAAGTTRKRQVRVYTNRGL
ncbi:phage head-tail joining protein [Sneathiella sp.]|uniref:phage head-tail joining protein n=1 Tax=Sneathiella sp. TaxID=1964365 RepID=UPI002FE1EE91